MMFSKKNFKRAGGLFLDLMRGMYFPDEVPKYTDVLLRTLFSLYYLPMVALVLAATHSALERIVWTLVIPVTQEMSRVPMNSSKVTTLVLGLWTIFVRMIPFVALGISVATVGHKILNCFAEAMVDAYTVHNGKDYPLLGARLQFILEKRSRSYVFYGVLSASVGAIIVVLHTNAVISWSTQELDVMISAWIIIVVQSCFVIYTLLLDGDSTLSDSVWRTVFSPVLATSPMAFYNFSCDLRQRAFAQMLTDEWWRRYVHHMRYIALELVLALSVVLLPFKGPLHVVSFSVELFIYLNFPHLFGYSVLSICSAIIRANRSFGWLRRHPNALPAAFVLVVPYLVILLHAIYYFRHHFLTVLLFVGMSLLLWVRSIDLVREFDASPQGSVLWTRKDTGEAIPAYIAIVLEDALEKGNAHPGIVCLDFSVYLDKMKMRIPGEVEVQLNRQILTPPKSLLQRSVSDVVKAALKTETERIPSSSSSSSLSEVAAATEAAKEEVNRMQDGDAGAPSSTATEKKEEEEKEVKESAPGISTCSSSTTHVDDNETTAEQSQESVTSSAADTSTSEESAASREHTRAMQSERISTYFRDPLFYAYTLPRIMALQSPGFFGGNHFRNIRIVLRALTLVLLAAFALIVTGIIIQAAFPQLRPWPVSARSTSTYDSLSIDHIVVRMHLLSKGSLETPNDPKSEQCFMPASEAFKWSNISSGDDDWYPSLCKREFKGVSVFELSLLSVASYLFNRDEVDIMLEFMRRHMNANWVVRELHGTHCVTTSSANEPTGWSDFVDFYNPDTDTAVIAIRGTDLMSLSDMLSDINLFFEATLYSVLKSVVPGSVLLPSSLAADLIHLASLPQDWAPPPHETWRELVNSKNSSLRECQRNSYRRKFYVDVHNHINFIATQGTPPSNIVLTGHSLGGAVANILGSTLEIQSVAFSSPGIVHSRKKFHVKLENIHRHTVSILSSNDIVSRIGGQGGELHHVDCLVSTREMCHAMEFLVGTLWRSCSSIRKRYPAVQDVV